MPEVKYTEDQLLRYRKYRNSGGQLGLDSWVSFGEPSADWTSQFYPQMPSGASERVTAPQTRPSVPTPPQVTAPVMTKEEASAWEVLNQPEELIEEPTSGLPVGWRVVVPGELAIDKKGQYYDLLTNAPMNDDDANIIIIAYKNKMRGTDWTQGTDWANQATAELRAGEKWAFEKEQALWNRQQQEKEFDWNKLQAEQNLARNYEQYRMSLEEAWRGPADWIKWWQLGGVPRTPMSPTELGGAITGAPLPPSPSWLPEFAPGQTTGQQITRESMPTPSGQQLARTPWSTREGLSGYAEWVGSRPWTDILEHMAMMSPETPAGAGRYAWSPARQRTYV